MEARDVFSAYCVESNSEGRQSVTAVILISEIIELSALFGSTCVLECLKHVCGIGSLDLIHVRRRDLFTSATLDL